MSEFLVLIAPSANRVYAAAAPPVLGAELRVLLPGAEVDIVTLAGVDYLAVAGVDLDVVALCRFSALLAVFRREGELLRPVEVPLGDVFTDDLVGIPKYQGKTNEQFTRLLVNVTLAAVRRPPPFTVLDPMSGRGTTLSTAWTLGHHAAGIEVDPKAVEAHATFLKTYLQRKRISHVADLVPLRRDGRSLGKRLQATARPDGSPPLELTVLTGDARDTATLFGKRTFDAIVTDAPYGVVHGSHTDGGRERSPAALLRAAVPVWAGRLRAGGALGIAWNTHGLGREDLAAMVAAAGLQVLDDDVHRSFSHRVDSSIQRDLLVAVRD